MTTKKETPKNNFNTTIGNSVLPAVLIKKKKIEEVLRKCVIELDEISGEKPFDFVNIRELLSVMDNAVFYMNAEIKGVDSLNGKWTILGK